MNNSIISEYKRLRKLDWPAAHAMRAAKVKDEFQNLSNSGLVKFEVFPDEFASIDDLFFDLDEKAKKELEKKIDQEGVWEIGASFRVSTSEKWSYSESAVCGFVGNDWIDSGYDIDIKENTILSLKKEQEKRWEEEAEKLAERATYAGVI